MKQNEDNAPLVTIFTYQERQLKLQQEQRQQQQKQQTNEQPNKVVTPDPDYDISPLNSLGNTDNELIDKDKTESDHVPVRKSTENPTRSGGSSVAIKIGEYADRKEPCKLHFISKLENNGGSGDVNSQLKNELEKTLSKLNIQSKKEAMEKGHNEEAPSRNHEHAPKTIPSQRSTSNVEKITALLITQNQSNNNNTEIPKTGNKFGQKKSESVPLNGILKAGSNPCSEHKNISFGKTTTTLLDNET